MQQYREKYWLCYSSFLWSLSILSVLWIDQWGVHIHQSDSSNSDMMFQSPIYPIPWAEVDWSLYFYRFVSYFKCVFFCSSTFNIFIYTCTILEFFFCWLSVPELNPRLKWTVSACFQIQLNTSDWDLNMQQFRLTRCNLLVSINTDFKVIYLINQIKR